MIFCPWIMPQLCLKVEISFRLEDTYRWMIAMRSMAMSMSKTCKVKKITEMMMVWRLMIPLYW
jgi:hypothetical protein